MLPVSKYPFSSDRSPAELYPYFTLFFFSLFEASTRLTRTQKHQQARLLPFRGFSSASATQMMNQSKNVDLIFFLHVRDCVLHAQ